MDKHTLNRELIEFIRRAPTPFHATAELARRLGERGFQQLYEQARWQIEAGGRYFVTRNDSSLIAFVVGAEDLADSGLRMVGAHTDSPCLHVKPEPQMLVEGYYQLGVSIYGGALLNPWFDRDLSLAGRINFRDERGRLASALLDFEKPIAVIPSLAIHLDRQANESRTVDRQMHLSPVLMRAAGDTPRPFRELLLEQARREHPQLGIAAILDYELSFYDHQPPALVGIDESFIAGARLDNLLSCFIGMRALTDSGTQQARLLVCNDHEEVGSTSASGADGPFLKSVLERLLPQPEALARCVHHSWLVSTDNAHGIHPNYPERHDPAHKPLLNGGPVIKVNTNQRYATNSEGAAMFRALCESIGVPVQSFVVRNDMGCGSTIGPITAGNLGVRTLDIGVPTFAMHSIRELAGAADTRYLYDVLKAYFAMP